jgi:hypothetical protein
LVFLFFVAPSLAVFYIATTFNRDVSKWNTGAVKTMKESKCTHLSLSVATPSVYVVVFINTTIRVASDYKILTRFVNFWFVVFWFLEWYLFCGTLSCSVLPSICVQSGRVEMEYGGGDKYVWQ